MGLTLITAPAAEPVSLAEAKAHCRIDDSDSDGLLAGYVLAARQWAEVYTRRALLSQTWDLSIDRDWPEELVDGEWLPRIVLPKPPLQSVTSITYVDTAGTTQTLAADQYRVNTTEMEGVIEPAYGVSWPSVRDQSRTILVRFVCGYGTSPGAIPEPIRQAILLTAGHWVENRESVVIGTIATEVPQAAEMLLFPYRVFY